MKQGPGDFKGQYEDDCKAEGGPPQVVRLTHLNETRIKRFVNREVAENLYGFFLLNCATQVKECLDAGFTWWIKYAMTTANLAAHMVPGHLGDVTHPPVITPWWLYLYARSISSLGG